MSVVPEARQASTVPGARQASTVPGARQARPARRPRPGLPLSPQRPRSPVRPAGPGRTGRPVRTGPSRPARGEAQLQPDVAGRTHRNRLGDPASKRLGSNRGRPAGRLIGRQSRTSFVLLLLGLLAGSLVCLLVVNTTLAANAIRISDLQQANQTGAQRVQELRQQVAAARSDAVIAQAARLLHMRPDGELRILDLGTGQIIAPRSGARCWPGGTTPRIPPQCHTTSLQAARGQRP